MKYEYNYEVLYLDYVGRKHLHFCKDTKDVKFLRSRYTILEVKPSKMVTITKENC